MKPTLLTLMVAGSLVWASPASFAATPMAGQALHDAHCAKCHTTDAYKEPKRKVKDFNGLKDRVQSCDYNFKTGWSENQTSQVIDYLNSSFYKFKK